MSVPSKAAASAVVKAVLPVLHPQSVLFGMVRTFLCSRWSPEQIALALARLFPKGQMRVSHETIYNCIYAQPVGELRKGLIANLRQARNKRTPHSKGQERRGQIPDMLSIHVRPPEVEDRQFSGHWEGDLIKGEGNASAVGKPGRTHQPIAHAGQVAASQARQRGPCAAGLHRQIVCHSQPLRKTVTYDQGKEMALHKQLTANTDMAVYFCDPHSPWQRGSNENTNGLLRQYLPKGTDLSGYTARNNWTPSPMKSTTDHAKGWGYDHPWPSTGSCS